jgi:hypothetical protein
MGLAFGFVCFFEDKATPKMAALYGKTKNKPTNLATNHIRRVLPSNWHTQLICSHKPPPKRVPKKSFSKKMEHSHSGVGLCKAGPQRNQEQVIANKYS